MKKHVIYWNGNYYYFLFSDENGRKYYLNHPSWDCGWYWGFGYITSFTNNRNPERSKDIASHQHFDTIFDKPYWLTAKNDITIYPVLNPGNRMGEDRWQLHELFSQFYVLRQMAGFAGKKPTPGMHITTSTVKHGNLDELAAHINQNMIPVIMQKIISMLTPEGEPLHPVYMGSDQVNPINMENYVMSITLKPKK